MKIAIRIVFAMLLLLGVVIGASPRVQAAFASKASFLPHPDCPKLRLDLSIRAPERACEKIRQAAADIAAALGLDFDLPGIYLVGDQQRFGELIGIPGARATGAVFLGEIYLSPRAFEAARWETVVAHELVHHAWREHLGPWSTQRRHPTWFQEGLAVYLSGGGAERASPDDALRALVAGRALTPTPDGSLFRPRTPGDDGLSYPIFYRQAALFVADLASDAEAFNALMSALRAGDSVAVALPRAYRRSIQQLWDEFAARARGKLREN